MTKNDQDDHESFVLMRLPYTTYILEGKPPWGEGEREGKK